MGPFLWLLDLFVDPRYNLSPAPLIMMSDDGITSLWLLHVKLCPPAFEVLHLKTAEWKSLS